jgi:hypothetical protein
MRPRFPLSSFLTSNSIIMCCPHSVQTINGRCGLLRVLCAAEELEAMGPPTTTRYNRSRLSRREEVLATDDGGGRRREVRAAEEKAEAAGGVRCGAVGGVRCGWRRRWRRGLRRRRGRCELEVGGEFGR